MMPPDPAEVFGPALRGNLKTYATATVGLLAMLLSAFGVLELTDKQLTALTGAFILVAFIFQRVATWKAQKAAAAASLTAAKTLAAVVDAKAAVPELPTTVRVKVRRPRKKAVKR